MMKMIVLFDLDQDILCQVLTIYMTLSLYSRTFSLFFFPKIDVFVL